MGGNYQVEFKSSRPELAGFQEYFEQAILPTLVEMEDQRVEAQTQAKKNGVIALIPLVLGIAAFLPSVSASGKTVSFSFLLSFYTSRSL